MALDALILDLGNVLAFHDNALLFRRLAPLFATTPEAMSARLEAGLWQRVMLGELPGDAIRQALVERLGTGPSPAEWEATWSSHFTINTPMVEVVERLVGRMRLVLLSNTHDQHVAYLRPRLPVLERFTGLVLSCEVGLVKPDPAIYRRALEAAGASPDRAAFFDDIEAYARAAQDVGIHGRVFTSVPRFLEDLAGLGLEP